MACKKSPCEKTPCQLFEEFSNMIGDLEKVNIEPSKKATVELIATQLKDSIAQALDKKDYVSVQNTNDMVDNGRLYVLRTNNTLWGVIGGTPVPFGGNSSGSSNESDPVYLADKPTLARKSDLTNLQTKTDVRLQGIDTTGGVIESILDIDGDVNFLHEYITTINTLVSERLADLQDTDAEIKGDLIQSINDRIILEENLDVRIKNLEKTNIGGEILTTNQGESFTDALDRMIPEPTENQLAYISDGNELRLYQNKGSFVDDTYYIDWQLIHTFGGATVTAGISSDEANARFVDKTTYNANKNATDTKVQQNSDKVDNLATSLAGKQPKTDPNLHTASKDTTGSINEVLELAKGRKFKMWPYLMKPDGTSYLPSELDSTGLIPLDWTPTVEDLKYVYFIPVDESYEGKAFVIAYERDMTDGAGFPSNIAYIMLPNYKFNDYVKNDELSKTLVEHYWKEPREPNKIVVSSQWVNFTTPILANLLAGKDVNGIYRNEGLYLIDPKYPDALVRFGVAFKTSADAYYTDKLRIVNETYDAGGKMNLGEIIALQHMGQTFDTFQSTLPDIGKFFRYWSATDYKPNARGRILSSPNTYIDSTDYDIGVIDEQNNDTLMTKGFVSSESLDIISPLVILTSGITVPVLKGTSSLTQLATEHPPEDVKEFTLYLSTNQQEPYIKVDGVWRNANYTRQVLEITDLEGDVVNSIFDTSFAPTTIKLKTRKNFMIQLDNIGNLSTHFNGINAQVLESGNSISKYELNADGAFNYDSGGEILFSGTWVDFINRVRNTFMQVTGNPVIGNIIVQGHEITFYTNKLDDSLNDTLTPLATYDRAYFDNVFVGDKLVINSSGGTSTHTTQQLAGLLDVMTNLFSKTNSNLGMGGISIDSNGHVLEGTTNTGKNIIEYLKGGGTTFKHIVESAADTSSSTTINIGAGIAGDQDYGTRALGAQSYGKNASSSQTYALAEWDALGSNEKIEFYFGKQLKTIYSEQDPQTHFATSTDGSTWTNTTHTADAMIKHLDSITGTSPASPIDIENQIFEDLETESKTLVGAMNEILHMVKTLQGK